jgi:cysteine desulfurase
MKLETNNIKLPIYLDYMATTPVDPRVAQKMAECLTLDGSFGNASSPHYYGLQAKNKIEHARAQVANLLNVVPESIIWTSGATEANNLALQGSAHFYRRQGNHLITCKTEHKAILDTCRFLETQGFAVTYLTPEKNGLLNLSHLEKAIRPTTLLISLMQVNNEIGCIQDIEKVGEIARAHGILFHVDAAQSAGKIPIDLNKLKVDLMSFSAHKIYGPKGVGALYVRPKPKLHLAPLIHGGEQEQNLRSGTLPTHQIVGMGEAFKLARAEMTNDFTRILKLREKLWRGIKNLPDIYLNGTLEQRIPGNLNVSFGHIDGEVLLAALKDIAVSQASACTKTVIEPSHVLTALGIDNNLALSSIRISLGKFTTEAEIDFAILHLNEVITKLRNNS